jgi:hypothetical protein
MRHRKAFASLLYDFPLMYITTQKSKDMISENGSRLSMGLQLHVLIAKHGLENVADMLVRLCTEQAHLTQDPALEESIKHLERLVSAACKIQDWK